MGDILASQSIFLNLVAAAIMGALIGVERQLRSQHTGLVTHALVALGAAAYTSLPTALGLVHDLRMSGQVVTGIGFLGAGLIIKDGTAIKGSARPRRSGRPAQSAFSSATALFSWPPKRRCSSSRSI